MDILDQLGIDVSDWGDYKGGAAKAAANPKYCYEWSFEKPGEFVVLNLWHSSLQDRDGVITLSDNFGRDARAYAREKGRANWKRRAERVDQAVRKAAQEGLPVRVIICDGERRRREDRNASASRVYARMLDPEVWAVTEYSSQSGDFTLSRGVQPARFVDQFTVDQDSDSPTERKAVLGYAFQRDPAVRHFVLGRAAGYCEWCKQRGFRMANGSVFLETHHVVPLSESGPDIVSNVVALCANHHREAHHGEARDVMRKRLLQIARGEYESAPQAKLTGRSRIRS
jgi:5-methylcytosine-specific restriction enzyme A